MFTEGLTLRWLGDICPLVLLIVIAFNDLQWRKAGLEFHYFWMDIRYYMYIYHLTCQHEWGNLSVLKVSKKATPILLFCVFTMTDWLEWVIRQSRVDAVTSCPSCPNMVNHLNGGLNKRTAWLQTDTMFCLHVSWSWLLAHVRLDKFLSSQGVSGFDSLQKLQHWAFDVMIKNTCSLCQPGSTLSSPIYPSYSSQSPPFSSRWSWLWSSALLHHWRSLVLSVYRRRGEGAGKRDSAPLTLPLSVYAPTDTRTLSTVRSSSLQQPKKGTRARRARRPTIATIKKKTQPGCVKWRRLELHNR